MKSGIGYVAFASLVGLLTATGCAAPEGGGEDDSPAVDNAGASEAQGTGPGAVAKGESGNAQAVEDEGDPNEVFTETFVSRSADGSLDIQTQQITRGQQIERREFLKAEAAGVPMQKTQTVSYHSNMMLCLVTAAAVWDQPNYIGNGLCASTNLSILQTDSLDLATIQRTTVGCGPLYWFGTSYTGSQCFVTFPATSAARSASAPNNRSIALSGIAIPSNGDVASIASSTSRYLTFPKITVPGT